MYILSVDCCYTADHCLKSLQQSDWQPFLGEQAVLLAMKFAGKIDQLESNEAKLHLINNIPLDWLTACVCEYILLSFDGSNAIVRTSGTLTNAPLTLNKIVSCIPS